MKLKVGLVASLISFAASCGGVGSTVTGDALFLQTCCDSDTCPAFACQGERLIALAMVRTLPDGGFLPSFVLPVHVRDGNQLFIVDQLVGLYGDGGAVDFWLGSYHATGTIDPCTCRGGGNAMTELGDVLDWRLVSEHEFCDRIGLWAGPDWIDEITYTGEDHDLQCCMIRASLEAAGMLDEYDGPCAQP